MFTVFVALVIRGIYEHRGHRDAFSTALKSPSVFSVFSVYSVYSVAKEMIIMKRGCVSSEIRATEGTVQLTVIFKMLDDNESV